MDPDSRTAITENALLGQAVGDAFGVPVEFLSREGVRLIDLRVMTGSDSEPKIHSRWGDLIPRGSWSDDTSMTVASMVSFIRKQGRIDYPDQLARFVRWWNAGEYCCLSYPFGLGGNIAASLQRYRDGTPALECGGKSLMDNGNGALMRILPFSLYCIFNELSEEETVTVTGNGSAITHGHEISRMCCFIWTEFLRSLSENNQGIRRMPDSVRLDKAIDRIEELPYRKWFSGSTAEELSFITDKRIRTLSERDIHETGYVVDTLYSALYSLMHADSFEMSIRNAIGLGYDTDTAGAVTGTAAGILYGFGGIPKPWLDVLKKQDYLRSVASDFAKCVLCRNGNSR